MKKYIFIRFIKSLFSIFIVTTIAYMLVYSFVPKDRVFYSDGTYSKLLAKPDQLTNYKYQKWEDLGYLEFSTQNDFCAVIYGTSASEYAECVKPDSAMSKAIVEEYTAKGWIFEKYALTDSVWAYRDISLINRITNFYTKMIRIDNLNAVQDAANPDLDRGYYFASDGNGNYGLMCSGCTYKYQVYVNSSFPFIHQNVFKLYLGESYPNYTGSSVLEVINDGQGKTESSTITYPTGLKTSSSDILSSCQYKYTLDQYDQQKFNDNYANCVKQKEDASMIGISFQMGTIALALSYAIGIPLGLVMASKKDKIADKIGMAYIIFIIAVPSLAYIYLFRYIGNVNFGFPNRFPDLGAANIRSYIMPIISLTLPSVASLLMWTRRYTVDQTSSEYVRFAKSKGLNQKEVFTNHILRNAIIPIAHGIPAAIIGSISGAIITEQVYAIPGMGKILPDAINSYNNNMIIAITFIFTALSIFSIFFGDVLITWIDPRIRLTDKGGR